MLVIKLDCYNTYSSLNVTCYKSHVKACMHISVMKERPIQKSRVMEGNDLMITRGMKVK